MELSPCILNLPFGHNMMNGCKGPRGTLTVGMVWHRVPLRACALTRDKVQLFLEERSAAAPCTAPLRSPQVQRLRMMVT